MYLVGLDVWFRDVARSLIRRLIVLSDVIVISVVVRITCYRRWPVDILLQSYGDETRKEDDSNLHFQLNGLLSELCDRNGLTEVLI